MWRRVAEFLRRGSRSGEPKGPITCGVSTSQSKIRHERLLNWIAGHRTIGAGHAVEEWAIADGAPIRARKNRDREQRTPARGSRPGAGSVDLAHSASWLDGGRRLATGGHLHLRGPRRP